MKRLRLIVLNSTLIVLIGLSAASCNVFKFMRHLQKEDTHFNSGYHEFLYVENQIILETDFMDGKQRNLLFDLGSPTNIIFLDTTFSPLIENQKPVYGLSKVKSADGIAQKQKYYQFGTLKNNSLSIENSIILSVLRPDPNACTKINGILGADNFQPRLKGKNNKIVIIRMQDSTLAILDALPSLENWIPIEARFIKLSHIKIAITIDGEKHWFYFDTGLSRSIVMTRETYKNTTGRQETPIHERKVYGYIANTLSGPRYDTAFTRAVSLNLGNGLVADSIPAISIDAVNLNVVGMEFISRYNVMVDYQNQRLYMQANPNYKHPDRSFFITKGFKVLNTKNEEILIMNITMDSPAEKAGLKIGDQLIKINNTVAKQGNNCEMLKLFSKIDGTGSDNEITVKRGDETLKFIL